MVVVVPIEVEHLVVEIVDSAQLVLEEVVAAKTHSLAGGGPCCCQLGWTGAETPYPLPLPVPYGYCTELTPNAGELPHPAGRGSLVLIGRLGVGGA